MTSREAKLYASKPDKLVRVLSVHNMVSACNIPLEAFAAIPPDRCEKYIVSLYQSTAEAYEFIQAEYPECDAKVVGLDLRTSFTSAIWRLTTLLRRSTPDVIHTHHIASGLLACLLGRLCSRARCVTTLHGEFWRYRLSQRMSLGTLMFLSHQIICNSKGTLNSIRLLRGFLLRRHKISVCYNGVNAYRIRVNDTDSQVPEDCLEKEFEVGFVGRLVSVKDVQTLIRGFARFCQEFPASRLTIVGDGPDRRCLERLTQELALNEQVRFLGSLDRSHVYKVLRQLDVFVVPSRSEGFCNAMVEAMFAERSVVASDIPVLREVLGSDSGLFFPCGDIEALAETLKTLAGSPELRRELSRNAFQRAAALFSLDANSLHHAKYYKRLAQ